MRVYEFSKQYNVSNKEALDKLTAAGFVVKSHMSQLDEAALAFLKQSFGAQKADVESFALQQSEPDQLPDVPTQVQEPEKKEKSAPSIAVFQQMPVEHVREGIVLASMRLPDAAIAFNRPITELILLLLKWGVVANKNIVLPESTVAKLARHFEIPIIKLEKKEQHEHVRTRSENNGTERAPIVVVVGHVDHGKTTLLDYIRKACVAAREKGGITQHLGAYEASTPHGTIVFLDTPGHEAFTKIRSRGVKVADIAILVIAADDGVMPQTVESIKLVRALEVPIVVAINKIDKVEPGRVESVKRELAQHNLLLEEWGGDVIVVPISAKKGIGVDQLLEMVVLKSHIMELKTEHAGAAQGYILESKVEKGRGPVATVICLRGEVKVGDYFVAGSTAGRVTSLNNSYGSRAHKAGPSVPVQVAGFNALPDAGQEFKVVDLATYRAQVKEKDTIKAENPRLLLASGTIKLVIKVDTNSSKEALVEAIERLSKKSEESGFSIVHAGIGQINESDVMYAVSTGAYIIGLHVKAEPNAALLAQKYSVNIRQFYIIYELLDALKGLCEKAVKPKIVRKKVGEAIVRRIFDIKNVGVIAGSYISDGYFTRDGIIIAWRGNKKIGEGKISSLQREKRVVKQVHAGFECGFLVEGFNEWLVDDRAECFIEVPKETK